MQLLFIIAICIIAVSIIVIAVIRTHLKNKSKELSEKISHISPFCKKMNYGQSRIKFSALNNGAKSDINCDEIK